MSSKPIVFIRAQHRQPFQYLRSCTLGLALLTLALAGAVPSFGATLTVANTNDDGAGSLRQAIATANAGDTINFSLPNASTITLTSNYLGINKNLIINGPGQTQLTIDAGNQAYGFRIDAGTTLSMSGLTVENAESSGIFSLNSNVTLSGVTVTGSRASGIFSEFGALTLNNCTLANNSDGSLLGGGNLYIESASVMVINSVISGGTATYGGGGIANGGTLTLIGSTMSGNGGNPNAWAGAIFNFGTMTILNSTISGNTATASGGGAAIYNEGYSTISNSTITGNSSYGGSGAGILNYAGTLTLKGTLLANNGAGGNCSSINGFNPPTTSLGYNLSDDTTCESWLTSSTDKNNIPAQLASGIQNNGGPTQTVALSPGSPAADAIPAAYCTDANGNEVTTDQRGIARPQGKGCDVGAYELVQAVPFSSFHPSLAIDNGRHPGYILTSTFTLGSASTGLNPATAAMTLKIANYTLTLPAGSFHQLWKATNAPYGYDGTVNGATVGLVLTPLGKNTFAFDAVGGPVSFPGIKDPVGVTLSLGNDTGTASVKAVITTF